MTDENQEVTADKKEAQAPSLEDSDAQGSGSKNGPPADAVEETSGAVEEATEVAEETSLDLSEDPVGPATDSSWTSVKETSPYDLVQRQEDTRGRIAGWLLFLLFFVVFAAFLTVWICGSLSEPVKDLLVIVFGPIVALVGSVTGFYFGGVGNGSPGPGGNGAGAG